MMSNTLKAKKKRPSTSFLLKNMKTVMTLSDRLKLSGIKEFKPQPDVKPTVHLNKNSKKRKSSFKIATMKNQRNPPGKLTKQNSNKNQPFKSKKLIYENPIHTSDLSKRNIKKSAQQTLSVSLGFIKECQTYKKKFLSPVGGALLSNQEKIIKAFSVDYKQKNQPKKEESENSISNNLASWRGKEKEQKNVNEVVLPKENKYEEVDKKETGGDDLKNSLYELAKTFPKEKPNEVSLEDVARIDKKYLESVLSLATNPEPSARKNIERQEIEKERTKKSNGKNVCSSEAKNKSLIVGTLSLKDKANTAGRKEVLNTLKNAGAQSQKNQTLARIVRDSTKSELRIQLREKRNTCSQRNSEIKIEKELVHSKSELNDGRKKRKPRNKILKSNNEEMIEIPFSSEVSKTNDVTELWRREAQKKSENSLTSHSSCTIPETEDIPKWKNFGLQSYRILHKLVEEEINKISKESENKNNTVEVKNTENSTNKTQENKIGSLRERIKSKNIFNKLKLPMNENLVSEKEALLLKKNGLLPEKVKNYSTYEGDKTKSEILSILDKDLHKTLKGELKLQGEKCDKFPSHAIENWSILNRLEQAFMALGNSNFQIDEALKTKLGGKNNTQQCSESAENDSKESEKQTKVKPQNQTVPGTLLSKKTPRPPSKGKTQDVKLPSPTFQSKEKAKQNEPSKTEHSNDQNQSVNTKESLTRKKTFNVITLGGTSIIHPQNSKSTSKAESNLKSDIPRKRLTQIKKPVLKTQDKDVVKNNSVSRSKSIEREEKPIAAKNPAKPTANEKPPHENFKSGIPKRKVIQKPKCEKPVPVEELLKQQMSEKKEQKQRSSSERPVKERSILSVHGKQQDSKPSKENLKPIQEKPSSNFLPTLKSSTGDLVMKKAQKNFDDLYQKTTYEINKSNISYLCAGLGELSDQDSENWAKKNSQIEQINFPNRHFLESKGTLTSDCTVNRDELFERNLAVEENSRELSNSRNLSWEKDIRRYREIVNDIMSQYKRIDGFLKQSERLGVSLNKSVRDISSKRYFNDDEISKFSDDSQSMSLKEYRKKIITEYQALPFFEYKQLTKEETRKKNLLVVSDFEKDQDFDVKDYQPRIKKVLDSQLYVDKDSLHKFKDPEEETIEKKSSLQERMPCQENGVIKKRCLKSYSLPKTIVLPGGEVYHLQSSNRTQKC